ncbi:MAG: hypothetical protein P4L59_16280 [Desulfosporosinus sp.]|nr:hypothetical protein [Desulfosporosinus sp.]
MGETVSNIIARVGADVSPLSASMKEAQNTILTFRDESLAALKSFGLPHVSSTNLVEAIQSGQRVIVDFVQESGESLSTFQSRVRETFQQAGLDISAYEAALTEANNIHASFANGAIKSFQASTDASTAYVSTSMAKYQELKESLVASFAAIGDSSVGMAGKLAAAGDIINTALPELFALGLAVMFVDKIYEWGKSVSDFAQETQDAERQFQSSMGLMSDQAEEFTKKLSDSYGVVQENLKDMMGKEYLNSRMLGFDPTEAEIMSEKITQLSYDLGKLRGVDPSTAFDALQKGVMGQTRGLMELGIRITSTDVKNEALRMGLIKQGQTMTDAQTSMAAYQLILEKTGQFTGYYGTQADTLSEKQARLDKDWDEMKRNLSEALIPALTELKTALIWVEEEFVSLGNFIAGAIRDITLFAEDVHTAISDLLALDFSSIGEQWAANYASVFDYGTGTNAAAEAMDNATTAANNQNAAQQALGKSLNANTMSFDQLHNIANQSGTGGGPGGTPTPPTMPSTTPDMSALDNKTKGIVIPISFKMPPIPPIPPIPPVPPVLFPALDMVTPVVENLKVEIGSLPTSVTVPIGVKDQTEPAYGTMRNKLDSFAPKLINVPVSVLGEAVLTATLLSMQNKLTGWQTIAVACFNTVAATCRTWGTVAATVFAGAQNVVQSWEFVAVSAFSNFQTSVARDFASAASSIHTWEVDASQEFETFVSNAGTCISSFVNNLHNDFNQVFTATESMAVSWANSIGQSIANTLNQVIAMMQKLAQLTGTVIPSVSSSIWSTVSGAYTGVSNWVESNKGWLVPLGAAAGLVGVTLATGGTDAVVAGIGAAGTALSGLVSNMGSTIPAFASGGIVTSATLGVFGEAGPEAVIPLSQLDTMLSGAAKPSNGGSNSSSSQPINVTLKLDGRTLARTLYQYTINESDRQGTTIGYNSSYNLPK